MSSPFEKRNERTPWPSMTTISPGAISRTNSAPLTSSAHVSEASTQLPSGERPRQSGRNPCGSRTPMSLFSVMIVRQNAPRTTFTASRMRSSIVRHCERAMRWTNTSESIVVWKTVP